MTLPPTAPAPAGSTAPGLGWPQESGVPSPGLGWASLPDTAATASPTDLGSTTPDTEADA
jgi:hypothetical protein